MQMQTVYKRAPSLLDLKCLVKMWLRHRPADVDCNCCGETVSLRMFGIPPRINAVCPSCGSLERHRLLKSYIDRNAEQLDFTTVLHFAPERTVRRFLEGRAGTYVGCDLFPHGDLLRINIEKMDLPDNHATFIACSHVLEHVDDGAALGELWRVLAPGGTAVLMFPIIEGWDMTFESDDVTTPADRQRYFGQFDHVRWYGRDARERITAAGFALEEYTAAEPDVSRIGLLRGEKIFLCRKPLPA